MKKVILLLLIIILGGLGIFYIYNNVITESNNKEDNNNMSDNILINDTKEEIFSENNESEDNTFKIKKVEKENFESDYKIVEDYGEKAKDWLSIEKQDNNMTITIYDSEINEMLLTDKNTITYNKKYNISNIDPNNIKTIFYGMEGQDISYPLILILQKDGTVKGIDMEYGYNTGNFIAKNISDLKNVVKFEEVDVSPKNDSGYIAVIAITEDDLIYEVGKF